MKIEGGAMKTGAAETSVEDHVRSMLHLMERGARVNLTDIPGDTTFLSSNFSGEASKAMAAHIKSALPHLSKGAVSIKPLEWDDWLKPISSHEPAPTLLDELSDEELFADRSNENPNVGKLAPHEPKTCATEGCERKAAVRFERGGVGSVYCSDCYLKVQAIPASADTQAGLGEEGEVVAWRAPINPHGQPSFTYTRTEEELVRFGHHQREPLVRQSALTACQQEVETLREGIKEIAERERGIRDNWTRFEAETGARTLELQSDLEVANDKVERLRAEIEAARNDLRGFLTTFVREHFPENNIWEPFSDLRGMLSQMDNASTIARDYVAHIARLEKALEPFAEIAGEAWADENGWTKAALPNDRVCDWFGPSAFFAARAALGGQSNG